MNTILVTGGNGQLGSELREIACAYPIYKFLFTDVAELDITNHKDVERFITENNIQIIINCAAHTAVDKAETEIEISDQLNHLAVDNFAKIAKEKSIQLIHVSTDYVFDGNTCKPYVETDSPNPQSVYGKTKLAGEQAMQRINPSNSIIIRTSWVYSSFGNNFVKTMLRLGKEKTALSVIYDQIGTPTYAKDLAKIILDNLPKIKNKEVEIFHYSNEGVCSWYDFAKAIFEITNKNLKVDPISTAQYPTAAKRPFYSLLSKQKIKEKFEVEVPYWKESLIACLEKLDELNRI
ncbi:dTDP-4-dehydrorhamnose reductase [Winogradskyella helgolandensis]|uniref:dTDP-4-dehydrorhamnose reductase n=1 Tax=Winogradskyella helgolandensis TaxID=2697010 RepID=UPI0015BC9707|nr:dTDP-4-dehydrorhamnose reductase [Winogradskyella helgolandensis]